MTRVQTMHKDLIDRGVIYRPYGAAREIFHNHDTEIVLFGAAGTGKTRAHLELLNLDMELYPGARGLLMRKTRTALTQTAMVTFERDVLAPAQRVTFHSTKQEYQYPNSSVVVVGGLDDPDQADKIMSGQYDRIHVVECTDIGEGAWMDLTTRLRNNRMPFQQIIGCCNKRPNSWVWRRGTRGELTLLESLLDDNPAVTNQYREILSKLRGQRSRILAEGSKLNAGSVQSIGSIIDLPSTEDYQ